MHLRVHYNNLSDERLVDKRCVYIWNSGVETCSTAAQKPPVSLKGKYIICDATANLVVIVTHLVVDGFNEPMLFMMYSIITQMMSVGSDS